MPARDLWSHIQSELRGRAEDEHLRVLRRHLAELHDEWKGPYKDLRDRLRRQVSRLEGHESVRSRAGQHDPFHVKRQGDARVVLAGMPNAGKSALVCALTGAAAIVAPYPFATTHPLPGMLPCEGGTLQLVDTPPVVAGLADGQGAGRPLLHLLSGADAIVIVVDLTADVTTQLLTVLEELAEACVHPIPGPVPTVLRARGKGGVKLLGEPLSRDEETTARAILAEAHVEHAEVIVRAGFEDSVLKSQVDGDLPVPTIVVGTRVDSAIEDAVDELRSGWAASRCLLVDTDRPDLLNPIAGLLLEALGFIGVQLLERPADKSPERTLLVHRANDVAQVADRAGTPPERLKGARVWGPSVPRPGQAVSLDHLVEAGDRVYLQS